MEYTPRRVVDELSRYIIGQNEAKRAVAIALRNRYRRSQLPKELRDEITPKNIIMSGPTGVGKTEIARRISKIVGAPFVKVEATKFTEVGYVGRDVDSMIRELAEAAIRLVREEKTQFLKSRIDKAVENRIVDILLPMRKQKPNENIDIQTSKAAVTTDLKEGKVEELMVEIEVEDKPAGMNVEVPGQPEILMGDLLGGIIPKQKKKRRVTVSEARKLIFQQELSKMLDMDAVISEALERAEQSGIIFIDEIDKIAGKTSNGPDVSREGVQRDILPLVEGCTVNTKYGPIKTDYILFIAAGAFHVSKISDLIPELQGRFPLLVKLQPLGVRELYDILTRTDNALIKQYQAMLGVDNIELSFTDEACETLAKYAYDENETHENIGARRLTSIMERLFDELAFEASSELPLRKVVVDNEYIVKHLGDSEAQRNIKKYIL